MSEIILREWADFDSVQGLEGRAHCQDDARNFVVYRLAQYLAFPREALSYIQGDLDRAQARGANLIAEKYARMMRHTDPLRFYRELEPQLEKLTPLKKRVLEQLGECLSQFEQAAAVELVQSHANARPDASVAGRVSAVDYYVSEAEAYSLQTLRVLLDGFAELAARGVNPIVRTWELSVILNQAVGDLS